jgi:hypothetical protein
MKSLTRASVITALAIAAAGLGATTLPPLVWPDAPVPASLSAAIPAARHQLTDESADRLPPLPLHLTFLEARCSETGAVALVFEEHRPPYLGTSYAVAFRGSMPTEPGDAWGGGVGIVGSVLGDPEFTNQMGRDPSVCPG